MPMPRNSRVRRNPEQGRRALTPKDNRACNSNQEHQECTEATRGATTINSRPASDRAQEKGVVSIRTSDHAKDPDDDTSTRRGRRPQICARRRKRSSNARSASPNHAAQAEYDAANRQNIITHPAVISNIAGNRHHVRKATTPKKKWNAKRLAKVNPTKEV